MHESTQLFSQAATLMMVGMGFVFGFLGFLIGVIKILISPLATRYPDHPPLDNSQKMSSLVENTPSSSTIAAISAAISEYRKKHQ